ncbi:MAG: Fe-S cluster assembly protein SufD [Parahaliea sp.]
MSDFMQGPLAAAASNVAPWLSDIQTRGLANWRKRTLPNRKTEAWKYNHLKVLQRSFQAASTQPQTPMLNSHSYPETAGATLVFSDGIFRPELSQCKLPAGIKLTRFADAGKDQAALIGARLGRAVNSANHLFAPLNEALLSDGVFIEIEADTVIEQALQVVWQCSGHVDNQVLSQRLLVCAGAHSRACIIESFVSSDDSSAFTSSISEFLLAEGATLEHYRLHLEEGEVVHIGGAHAHLQANATFQSFHLALGSRMKRIDITVDHQGAGAHADIKGIYLPRGDEQIDYHTCIEHTVPHCTSNEVFRGIVADRASAIFNGRIHIHQDAQKTRAELSNKNLLMSAQAEINTKPELEIYADDVQCAHGATVAQLDTTALHYLRTRGIPADEAEVMLSYGFINELIDDIGNTAVHSHLKPLLAARFAGSTQLARHILEQDHA